MDFRKFLRREEAENEDELIYLRNALKAFDETATDRKKLQVVIESLNGARGHGENMMKLSRLMANVFPSAAGTETAIKNASRKLDFELRELLSTCNLAIKNTDDTGKFQSDFWRQRFAEVQRKLQNIVGFLERALLAEKSMERKGAFA